MLHCTGSAQAISTAEGASRRLTPDPKWVSISVTPLGLEEQQQFTLVDISVADVRHDAMIYIPIAASGKIKLQEEQKRTGMQKSELPSCLSAAADSGNLSCSSPSWPLNSIRPSALVMISHGVLSMLAGKLESLLYLLSVLLETPSTSQMVDELNKTKYQVKWCIFPVNLERCSCIMFSCSLLSQYLI